MVMALGHRGKATLTKDRLSIMRRFKLSPSQLIALCFVGYAVACIGFALPGSRRYPLALIHAIGFWPWLMVSLGLMAAGGLLVYRAQAELAEGVRRERWSQEQLEGPRRLMDHSAVRLVEVLALVAAVVLLAAELITKRVAAGTLCLPLIYIPMLFRGIRVTLKEPRVSQSPTHFDNLPPLQSEHWGRDRVNP
jgi:hypothetical protein